VTKRAATKPARVFEILVALAGIGATYIARSAATQNAVMYTSWTSAYVSYNTGGRVVIVEFTEVQRQAILLALAKLSSRDLAGFTALPHSIAERAYLQGRRCMSVFDRLARTSDPFIGLEEVHHGRVHRRCARQLLS
jgi:hypothetical protein